MAEEKRKIVIETLKEEFDYNRVKEKIKCKPEDVKSNKAFEFRKTVTDGIHKTGTNGFCNEFAQINVIAIPNQYADDFEKFCSLNTKTLPLLEISKGTDEKIFPNLCPLGCKFLTDVGRYHISTNKETYSEIDIDKDQLKDVMTRHNVDIKDFTFFAMECHFLLIVILLILGGP